MSYFLLILFLGLCGYLFIIALAATVSIVVGFLSIIPAIFVIGLIGYFVINDE